MSTKTALVAGASGLVGSNLLNLLINDPAFERVKVITRKPLGIQSEKISELIINFDELNQHAQKLSADVVFCCLGTTIRTAGSQENFRKVDFTYCVELAKVAKSQGAKQFILVSSIGADASSSNFYLKTKGETEEAISALHIDRFAIMRPSMLLGDRKEFRAGELAGKFIMQALSFAFVGGLKKYKGIQAETVARCMITASKNPEKGKMIFEGDLIGKYAGK